MIQMITVLLPTHTVNVRTKIILDYETLSTKRFQRAEFP